MGEHLSPASDVGFLRHPSMTLILFWKAKKRRGSKKETVLLCTYFSWFSSNILAFSGQLLGLHC